MRRQLVNRAGITLLLILQLGGMVLSAANVGAEPDLNFSVQNAADSIPVPRVFVHTGFENASPLNWETDSAGRLLLSLVYDHERFSRNQANGHWHFKVEAPVGQEVTMILRNFDNIWNGMTGSQISDRSVACVSFDGINWENRETEKIDGNRLVIKIKMEKQQVYIASVQPYSLHHLEKFLTEIRKNPLVSITQIGKTSEGRSLEIIRIGNENAPKRVFLRARAHAFESGGNWTVEGLVGRLLQNDAETKLYRSKYCVYILPMANKDGVFRGKTRFNSNGYDLNRKWDKEADPVVAPENYALEMWLKKMIAANKKPDLALDLHNDAGGYLHVSHPEVNSEVYLNNMAKLEAMLRKYTWFTEGSTKPAFRNPGSLGEGLLERYGIEAAIYELNYEWIEGLKKSPLAKDWILLGRSLPTVFYHYFEK